MKRNVGACSIMAAMMVAGLWCLLPSDQESSRVQPGPLAATDAQTHTCGPGCNHSHQPTNTKVRSREQTQALQSARQQASAFTHWWAASNESDLSDPAHFERGRELARQRREAMQLLLREDPDAALQEALGYAAHAALPPELRALVEEPFSTTAQLDVEIACGADSQLFHRMVDPQGRSWGLSMPQTHRVGLTKRNLPLQGIRLDDLATVRADPFQVVEGQDASHVLSEWPSGQSNPDLCFQSGQAIEGPGVTAVLGGRVFRFQDLEALATVESSLLEADSRPGMDSGSSWLVVAASGGDLEQFPSQRFTEETVAASYATTTGPKTALFILVDFTGAVGQPINPTTLEQVVDLDCNNALVRYSYNQTSMDATVTSTTYRMPGTIATYLDPGDPNTSLDDGYHQLHTDAVAAYVNDGNPDPFGAYDTVCVAMTNIGYTWAGLATVGGQRIWIHNSFTAETITHEFGHNYGLMHASYWKFDESNAASTNPVDPSGKGDVIPEDDDAVVQDIEYGDLYDLMGNGNVADGHFHAAGKAFLGWIPPSDVEDLVDATDNGTYRITRFDDQNATGSRGLRIAKSATSDHYWVGYRKDYSQIDDFAKGAYLTWERALGDPGRNRTWLVDTTPLSADGKADAPITLGRTYTDTASNVHITPVATGGTAPNEWLDVTVNFGSFPGNSNPTGTLVGPTSVNARETILFNVEASDGDGDALAYSWDMGDGVVKDNSPTIAHSWIQGGSYDIAVTISDMKGGAFTLQSTITVTDPLNSWTARTSGTTYDLHGIAANDSHVVAVGGSYSDAQTFRGAVILRSSDGITWTNVTPGGSVYNMIFYDVCWTGSEFLACNRNYDFGIPGWQGEVWSSSDGSNWTRVYQTAVANTPLYAITTDGSGVVVAAGFSGTVARRTSGGAWSAVAAGIPSTQGMRGAAYGENTYVLVGHPNENTGSETVWTSPDGLTWTERTSGTGLTNTFNEIFYEDLSVVHHTGELFLASGSYARARYSTDQGQTWLSNQTGDRYQLAGFATGAGLHYAVGINRDSADADIDLVSSDGLNWNSMNPGSLADRNGVGFFANTFISVGDAGSIRQSGVVSGSSTFSDFADTHFPGGGNDALADSNPDGDWASNLIEYALGGIPDSASSSPGFPVFSLDGSDDPVLEISRDQRRSDVAYSVWWSTNLIDWTRQGLTIETDNDTTLRVVADGVDTSNGRGFLQLRVDQ